MLPKKPRKKRQSTMPRDFVVLAVVPGGWCIMLDGAYHSSAEMASGRTLPGEVCFAAVRLADTHRRSAVMVYELPSVATNGKWAETWKSAFRLTSGTKMTIGVPQSTWRARITGTDKETGQAARDRELRVAETIRAMTGYNEAAAVCVALFGYQCVEVGKMVAAKSKVRACL